jgi:hypothetical protein
MTDKELLFKIKSLVLELNPYEVVDASLDGFDPYITFTFGGGVDKLVNELKNDYEWEEWLYDEYLCELQQSGATSTIKFLKDKLYREIGQHVSRSLEEEVLDVDSEYTHELPRSVTIDESRIPDELKKRLGL